MNPITAATLAPAVEAYLDAAVSGTDEARAALRPHLSEDVEFPFTTMVFRGPDEVLERMAAFPSAGRFDGATWAEPIFDGPETHLRADLPPGLPISAMEWTVRLDDDGRIAQITIMPHHPEPADLADALTPGVVAPDFSLPDTNGSVVALDAAGANATVVLWTCNHCPWALGWHERLQRVANDYRDRGVRMLQINSNDPTMSPYDKAEACTARTERDEFAGPYLLDDGQKVARAWGARHTPDVFVLDSHGVVTYHGAPDAAAEDESLDAVYLREALDDTLAHAEVRTPQTVPVGCTIKWTL